MEPELKREIVLYNKASEEVYPVIFIYFCARNFPRSIVLYACSVYKRYILLIHFDLNLNSNFDLSIS